MVLDWFKRLFRRTQALESNERTDERTNEQTNERTDEQSSLEFDKESIQLGLAAGYTGRSIHDINSSLSRIESIIPSKDWLLIQFEEYFRRHEENEQRRLEILLKALNSLNLLSEEAPEPLKAQLIEEIKAIEKELGLSDRMKELVQLVKYYGEVSYTDLAKKLVLTPSGFRSLLSMTMERTNEIEKIDYGDKKKKFLRYKGQTTGSSVQSNVQTDENQSNEQTDKQT